MKNKIVVKQIKMTKIHIDFQKKTVIWFFLNCSKHLSTYIFNTSVIALEGKLKNKAIIIFAIPKIIIDKGPPFKLISSVEIKRGKILKTCIVIKVKDKFKNS